MGTKSHKCFIIVIILATIYFILQKEYISTAVNGFDYIKRFGETCIMADRGACGTYDCSKQRYRGDKKHS